MPISNPPLVRPEVARGSYSGNDTANRAIPHGLGALPQAVFIFNENGMIFYWENTGVAEICYLLSTTSGNHAVTVMTDTNFYVGNAANYGQSANAVGTDYQYVVVG